MSAKAKSNAVASKPAKAAAPIIQFRPYQLPVFLDRTSGVMLLHWSRQIGKSFTLAAWAVDRLLTRPGRLVTVLSNSRDNGAEFLQKCAEVCRLLEQAFTQEDLSPDATYEAMRMELRITVSGKTGRIKVLAANPRTARGFSGDLILDEFAFHEDSPAIWEAAEPILSSNADYLCRIASTGNGKHNMFFKMCADDQFKLSRVPRSLAWKQGVKVYDPNTRKPITPDEARAKAMDKAAYDQNYECAFRDENMALLTNALIDSATDLKCGVICDQAWNTEALSLLLTCRGDLYAGVDVARKVDFTVIAVLEKFGESLIVRALLRLSGMRLPDQQKQFKPLFALQRMRHMCVDMTGMGVGLTEYAQDEFGRGRISGINFSSTVPLTKKIAAEGRKAETVRVTEALAVELLGAYEDRRIKHPCDNIMREDLRKPERIVSPGGRVSIAATRDEAGHADHFWALALALDASGNGGGFAYRAVNDGGSYRATSRIGRPKGILV